MIHVEDLSFSYSRRGSRPDLFSGLSIELDCGGIYGLLGKNGAGKTSLLRIITGQIFRDRGECRVLGYEPGLRDPRLLREIYFLPEEFRVPSIPGTAYVDTYAPFYPGFDPKRFGELAAELEIDPGRKLSSCSYGQKKKFLLAFALASGCRILLLDEPTNGLDIPSKRQFRRAVAASIGDDQIFLISTHQVRDMEHLIDPIIVLESGSIVFFHDLDRARKALSVSEEPSLPDDDGVVYAEKGVGGYTVVRTGGRDDREVDLELLFNAVIESPDRINAVCSGEGE